MRGEALLDQVREIEDARGDLGVTGEGGAEDGPPERQPAAGGVERFAERTEQRASRIAQGRFDACEAAVQEALLAAAVKWPSEGVPRNPRGLSCSSTILRCSGGAEEKYFWTIGVSVLPGEPFSVAADADELDDAVGPRQMTVERVLSGKQLPSDAGADDHHALGVHTIGVGEVPAGDDRDAKRGKEARRHRTGARVWVVRRVLVPESFDRERAAAARASRVAPRHGAAERDLFDARHGAQAASNLPVEPSDLFGCPAV